MLEKMVRLRNTLMLVETKGESTKLMAGSLQFIDEMIDEIAKTSVVEEDAEKKTK